MKILLHSCCGPCSLEPVRLLHEAGHELTIFYANSNIQPQSEYERRFDTLRAWADEEGLPVIEGDYNSAQWEKSAGVHGAAQATRSHRCRACYRLRLEEVARYAAQHGFDAISTTLSVSPYQYADIIEEELVRAAENAGVQAVYEDFRPYYEKATKLSREKELYRQNYCGCRFSAVEAAQERKERKQEREKQKAQRRAERAAQEAAEQAERDKRKAERAAYDQAQAKKRAILKALRAQHKEQNTR